MEIDDFECSELWQENYKEDSSQIQSRDASGKFVVTFAILDSLMKNTKEKIILVSYSTKVFCFLISKLDFIPLGLSCDYRC